MTDHDTKEFFTELADNEVTGFVIIETGRGQYRLAEKWKRADDEPKWVTYWVPAHQLESRLEDGLCEKKGTVSDEQFEAVCKKTDQRALAA